MHGLVVHAEVEGMRNIRESKQHEASRVSKAIGARKKKSCLGFGYHYFEIIATAEHDDNVSTILITTTTAL